jgi:hypothetical protein
VTSGLYYYTRSGLRAGLGGAALVSLYGGVGYRYELDNSLLFKKNMVHVTANLGLAAGDIALTYALIRTFRYSFVPLIVADFFAMQYEVKDYLVDAGIL